MGRLPRIESIAATLLVPCFIALIMPHTAHAQPQGYGRGYGYGYGYGYGNTTVVIPSSLVVREQYYDFSVGGLVDLCAQQPDLCELPVQQDMLSTLKTERIVGWSLVGLGSVAMIASLAFVFVPMSQCSKSPYGACHPNWAGFAGVAGAGLLADVAGFIVLPTRHELQRFVNQTNATHADPIKVQLGWVAPSTPGLQLAGAF